MGTATADAQRGGKIREKRMTQPSKETDPDLYQFPSHAAAAWLGSHSSWFNNKNLETCGSFQRWLHPSGWPMTGRASQKQKSWGLLCLGQHGLNIGFLFFKFTLAHWLRFGTNFCSHKAPLSLPSINDGWSCRNQTFQRFLGNTHTLSSLWVHSSF